MEYIGRPRGEEDRGPSNEEGLLTSDILGGGLESLSPPALVSELNKGERSLAPICQSSLFTFYFKDYTVYYA